jgi:hypothetical protein
MLVPDFFRGTFQVDENPPVFVIAIGFGQAAVGAVATGKDKAGKD